MVEVREMIKIILKSKKESGSCPKATQDLELNTKNHYNKKHNFELAAFLMAQHFKLQKF